MKIRTLLFAAAASVLLAAVGCQSYEMLNLEPEMPSDLTVDQLLERMKKATDPKGIYANVKSYKMVQNINSPDGLGKDTYTSEIYFKAPDKMRQVSLRNKKPFMILVFRDGKAWSIDPKTKKATEIPSGTPLNLVKTFSDLVNPAKNLKDIYKNISIDIDLDEQRQKQYYRLICRIEDPDVAPYVFYINPVTYQTEKLQTILYGQNGSQNLYTATSENYVWRDDVCIPLRSLVTVRGKTDVSNTVSFVLNPELPESLFEAGKPWNYQTDLK